MPKKYYETDELLALQRTWDAKLKDEGFVDLEQRALLQEKEARYLLGTSGGDLARGSNRRAKIKASKDYYRSARQHAWSIPEVRPERRVWDLHAEGVGVERIVATLRDTHGLGRRKVTEIIHCERAKMRATWAREAQEEYDSRET